MAFNKNSNSDSLNDIYRSRITILEYLEERDYNVEDYKNFSFGELKEMCENEQLDFILEKNDKKNKQKIFVKYISTNSLNLIKNYVNELYFIENILNVKTNDEIIFITRGKISKALKIYKNKLFDEQKIFISYYFYKDHVYNILKHSLVPKHVKLKKKEVAELIEKYNITNPKELPEINVYDPVAIRIGLRPNDICKIYRGTQTSIISKYYRYCIN